VSAKDLGTGKEQQITITASTNLSKDEVDRMIKDADAMRAEDARKKEEAEIRNTANSLIYSTEKSLKEIGDKADAGIKGEVETALAELKRVSENGTSAEVKTATEALQTSSYKLAEALYQKTAAAGPDGAPGAAGSTNGANGAGSNGTTTDVPHGDDVIDAEFKEAK
jgi:molecular chaperone DnaK